jgi:protein gp37
MTAIQWTEKTWNPVVGCSIHSPGCTHCYAMHTARRLARIDSSREKYSGLTIDTKGGPVWNGKLRFWEPNLLEPLSWKRPSMVFVNSMSDLAHHAVSVEWFERIWHVMVEARRANGHIFQVLTKRPETLLKLLAAIGVSAPEPGIWLGVSAETQLWWEARVPVLRDLPTEVPWVSAEPQLGPIRLDFKGVRWVVQGGESGRRARPFDLEWARLMRDACHNASVPYFLKQIGRVAFDNRRPFPTKHAKGGNPQEWPDDLRIREWPT